MPADEVGMTRLLRSLFSSAPSPYLIVLALEQRPDLDVTQLLPR